MYTHGIFFIRGGCDHPNRGECIVSINARDEHTSLSENSMLLDVVLLENGTVSWSRRMFLPRSRHGAAHSFRRKTHTMSAIDIMTVM